MGSAAIQQDKDNPLKEYPIKTPEETGLSDWFSKNTNTPGMAWGGGLNGSDPNSERVIVLNTNHPVIKDPNGRASLTKNESIRHQMDEKKYNPNFELTQEQKEWSKGLGGYANNPTMLKQTIVARLASGDPSVPNPTLDELKEAQGWQNKPTIRSQQAIEDGLK